MVAQLVEQLHLRKQLKHGGHRMLVENCEQLVGNIS
jgi:hypothetical protein